MCGIAGYVAGSDPRPFAALQATALGTLAHRGPDHAGWLVDDRAGSDEPPPEPGRYGLFFRRLSILDLSQLGRQPMTTPNGRYAIIFNGEIYNYVELREQLTHGLRSARSRTPKSSSQPMSGGARLA